MSAAELQLAARIDGLRADDVREALWERRQIVKAWSMRGTLHLLVPDDLVAFVSAATTRERWREDVWLRFVELSYEQVESIISAVGALLTDRPMTRAELADGVAARVAARVANRKLAAQLRTGWGTFLGAPAQRGWLCFGPNDGRNVTFVKPSAWLGRPVAREERDRPGEPLDALAGLIRRFLATFPGSSRDMVGRWWGATRSGLVADAAARLGDEIVDVEVDGVRAWALAGDERALAARQRFRGVRLLPGFDPFVNELPRRVDSVLPVRTAGWVTPVVLIDGRVAGTWQLAGGRSGRVTVQPFGRWRGGIKGELAAEVDRIAAFLERPLRVSIEARLPVAG